MTLKELSSIAELASIFANVDSRSREAKRNFKVMLCWFKTHWDRLCPWLSLIELRDDEMRVIDGNLEIIETGRKNFPLN
jgi:hypothetical protein